MLEIQVLSENRMMDGKREGWGGGELAQRTKIRGLTLIGNLPNSAEGVERGGYDFSEMEASKGGFYPLPCWVGWLRKWLFRLTRKS